MPRFAEICVETVARLKGDLDYFPHSKRATVSTHNPANRGTLTLFLCSSFLLTP
jgi:hypothetical protein